jgi:hypothetical protein
MDVVLFLTAGWSSHAWRHSKRLSDATGSLTSATMPVADDGDWSDGDKAWGRERGCL